ncbi:MAG TPA: hypothetical protein EYN91_04985 [Candidatus Melainabacteria bacterium]|nr:hypothetical protein [Candidatus Melainabacteria bacterium]
MLSTRVKTGMMMGSFYEYGNLLYCAQEAWMATKDKEVAGMRLQTVFPDFYKPTLYELFEAAARQTGTTFKHGEGRGWMFERPPMPLPFSLTIAEGWRKENRGSYVAYIPAEQPVGMDVYMFGTYSDLNKEDEQKFRGDIARFFSKPNRGAKPEAMSRELVDDCEALFCETDAPKPGVIWRQWSFVKNGRSFVIVSALDKANSEKLFPEVRKMVASFQVIEPEPKCTGLEQELNPEKIVRPQRVPGWSNLSNP